MLGVFTLQASEIYMYMCTLHTYVHIHGDILLLLLCLALGVRRSLLFSLTRQFDTEFSIN